MIASFDLALLITYKHLPLIIRWLSVASSEKRGYGKREGERGRERDIEGRER